MRISREASARRLLGTIVAVLLASCGSNEDAGGGAPVEDVGSTLDTNGGLDAALTDSGPPLDGNTDTGIVPPADAGPDTHKIGSCTTLPAAGTLENITPAALDFAKWCVRGGDCSAPGSIETYGAHGLAIDPSDSGTLYLGTDTLGFWKTTDCGATWVKIDTGTHAKEIDSGRNWTIVIDKTDSKVIYTTPGYGAEGLYKSKDGGVNWEQMFPVEIQKSLPYGGFIETISLDPSDHRHLVVSFHINCTNAPTGGGDWNCLAESSDSGTTWALRPSPVGNSEGYGQTVVDAKTWFMNDGTGIFRTTNGGTSWDKVYSGNAGGHVYLAPDKKFYAGGSPIVQSADGITWTPLSKSPSASSVNGSNPLASDGVRLFASGGQYGGSEPTSGWYASAPLSDANAWTPIFTPTTMRNGGSTLIYDPDHHLLYSTNLISGVFRVVVP